MVDQTKDIKNKNLSVLIAENLVLDLPTKLRGPFVVVTVVRALAR
jgi:hypothetical protein